MSDKREAYKVGNSTPSALESALKIKTNGYGSSNSNKIREVGSSDIGKPTRVQGLQTSYESEQWRGAEQRGKELDNRKGKRQYLFQKCDTIARMAV